MNKIPKTDPWTISEHPNLVGSLNHNKNSTITYHILVNEEFAVICDCEWFTNKRSNQSKWLTYQLEMPKEGIPWIVNTLENKFLKLSHEGGLPADVRHYEEVVNGEKLGIGRQMNLGSDGHRESGYSIITMSRPEQGGRIGKRMNFTDSFLFEHGFFDLLKRIAEQIESGLL